MSERAYKPIEVKPGEGVAFTNKKNGNDRAPDWKGRIASPSGEEFDLAIWQRHPKSGGAPFLSIKAEVPRDKAPRGNPDADESPF